MERGRRRRRERSATGPSRRTRGTSTAPQREYRADLNEKADALAKQMVGKAEKSREQAWPVEGQMADARTACVSDRRTFGMLLDATRDERRTLFAQMTSGKARWLRMLIAEEQLRT